MKGNVEQAASSSSPSRAPAPTATSSTATARKSAPTSREIGKKLSKEALYESILYPSAGISHNFETWVVETTSGDNVQGVLISQTPAEVTVKGLRRPAAHLQAHRD